MKEPVIELGSALGVVKNALMSYVAALAGAMLVPTMHSNAAMLINLDLISPKNLS